MPFSFYFCIKTVLLLVIQIGKFPFSKHFCKFLLRPSWILLKFFNQEPWTQSGPGAFQFGIFLNIFLSFSGAISNFSCPSWYSKSLLKFLSHSASFSCSFLYPLILPKIPVPFSNQKFLSFDSSFLHCLTLYKTLLDCTWMCSFVDTGLILLCYLFILLLFASCQC